MMRGCTRMTLVELSYSGRQEESDSDVGVEYSTYYTTNANRNALSLIHQNKTRKRLHLLPNPFTRNIRNDIHSAFQM
jgi:hypothetical protein